MKRTNGKSYFYQWELNQLLVVEEDCTDILYGNGTRSEGLLCKVKEQDGKRVADVPNELLQTAADLHAYAWDAEKTCVVAHCVFGVEPMAKPADYVYTPTEVRSFDTLQAEVKQVLQELLDAKENGEFNGPQGEPGQDAPADTYLPFAGGDMQGPINMNGNAITGLPVAIISQPVSRAVELGEIACFAVVATGESLTYRWQYMLTTDTVWRDTTMEGNTTDTLIVEGKTSRNGYQYHCIITDKNGNRATSNAVTLTVKERLRIVDNPVNQSASVGETAIFRVVAAGEGLTYQWQWYRTSSSSWGNTTVEGNATAAISVPATAERNGYRYRCVVTDGSGNSVTSAEVTLTVTTAAKLNGYRFTVAAGSKVNLLDFRNGTDCLYGILSVHNGGSSGDLMMVLNVSKAGITASNTTIAGDGTVELDWDSDCTGYYLNGTGSTLTCTFIPLI